MYIVRQYPTLHLTYLMFDQAQSLHAWASCLHVCVTCVCIPVCANGFMATSWQQCIRFHGNNAYSFMAILWQQCVQFHGNIHGNNAHKFMATFKQQCIRFHGNNVYMFMATFRQQCTQVHGNIHGNNAHKFMATSWQQCVQFHGNMLTTMHIASWQQCFATYLKRLPASRSRTGFFCGRQRAAFWTCPSLLSLRGAAGSSNGGYLCFPCSSPVVQSGFEL